MPKLIALAAVVVCFALLCCLAPALAQQANRDDDKEEKSAPPPAETPKPQVLNDHAVLTKVEQCARQALIIIPKETSPEVQLACKQLTPLVSVDMACWMKTLPPAEQAKCNRVSVDKTKCKEVITAVLQQSGDTTKKDATIVCGVFEFCMRQIGCY